VWTLLRVAEVIERLSGVVYHPGHAALAVALNAGLSAPLVLLVALRLPRFRAV
jgi:hypothetical protein